MASDLVVPVCRIRNLREHPNAALLGLADVLGYQMVVPLVEKPGGPVRRRFQSGERDAAGKRVPAGQDGPGTELVDFDYTYGEGELVVYFPAGTIIPAEWAERFGVRELLRGPDKDRVGQLRLRGEPSFGLVVALPGGAAWKEGDNVAAYYGARKYEPPVRVSAGDDAPHDPVLDPRFEQFTDVQNGRIHTDVFRDGEEVVFTEKIHGTNSRLGFVDGRIAAGSRTRRKERPAGMDDAGEGATPEALAASTYWFPWSLAPVRSLLAEAKAGGDAVLYGEVYGGNVQSLPYGVPKGRGLGYRAFGLRADGRFLDWDAFAALCGKHGLATVPVVYRGPFSLDLAKKHAEGATCLTADGQIREGIVAYPVKERTDPRIGRAVLKYVSVEYDLSKHKEKDNTDV